MDTYDYTTVRRKTLTLSEATGLTSKARTSTPTTFGEVTWPANAIHWPKCRCVERVRSAVPFVVCIGHEPRHALLFAAIQAEDGTFVCDFTDRVHNTDPDVKGWPAFAFPHNPPKVVGPAGDFEVEYTGNGFALKDGDTVATLNDGRVVATLNGMWGTRAEVNTAMGIETPPEMEDGPTSQFKEAFLTTLLSFTEDDPYVRTDADNAFLRGEGALSNMLKTPVETFKVFQDNRDRFRKFARSSADKLGFVLFEMFARATRLELQQPLTEPDQELFAELCKQMKDEKMVQTPGDLDILWTLYYATGDKAYADRVLLAVAKDESAGMLCAAAAWSHQSHIDQGLLEGTPTPPPTEAELAEQAEASKDLAVIAKFAKDLANAAVTEVPSPRPTVSKRDLLLRLKKLLGTEAMPVGLTNTLDEIQFELDAATNTLVGHIHQAAERLQKMSGAPGAYSDVCAADLLSRVDVDICGVDKKTITFETSAESAESATSATSAKPAATKKVDGV